MPDFEGLDTSDKNPGRRIERPNFSRDLYQQAQAASEAQQAETGATTSGQNDQTALVSSEGSPQAGREAHADQPQASQKSDVMLADDEFTYVGNFLSPFNEVAARENFAALSSEGKAFVKEVGKYIRAIREVESPDLRNATMDQRAEIFGNPQAEWRAKLTPEQITAIADYTGSAYGSVNSYCRAGKAPDYILTIINHLDAGLQTAIVPEDTIVQRVVRDTMLPFFKEGEFFLNEGYTSTALDSYPKWSNTTHLFIELPKGSQAALLQDISSVPQEHEVLLPRGGVMRVEQIVSLKDVKAALPEADQALLTNFPDNFVYMVYTGVAQKEIVKER